MKSGRNSLQSASVIARTRIENCATQPSQQSRSLEKEINKLKLANRELEVCNLMVSHDLRTPLATICMYAEAVLKHCSNNLDEQCRNYISFIASQSQHMNQLIDNLMNFSVASCKEIKKERVDLSALANIISTKLKQIDPHRSVEFNISTGIEVSGDKCLLQDLLENLIGNAWKFTGKKESATIEFGVMDNEGTPKYFVRDNGIGFAMNQTDRLFEICERLHCNNEYKGFGVGLATVKRIIQQHGGTVWAEGEVGKGATFYFNL